TRPPWSTATWAPLTTALLGSVTRTRRSAAITDEVSARRNGNRMRMDRKSSSFTRERGYRLRSRRSPGLASWAYALRQRQPSHAKLHSGRRLSSLTVARQRGILTRFPVHDERHGRANFRLQRTPAEKTLHRNFECMEKATECQTFAPTRREASSRTRSNAACISA